MEGSGRTRRQVSGLGEKILGDFFVTLLGEDAIDAYDSPADLYNGYVSFCIDRGAVPGGYTEFTSLFNELVVRVKAEVRH